MFSRKLLCNINVTVFFRYTCGIQGRDWYYAELEIAIVLKYTQITLYPAKFTQLKASTTIELDKSIKCTYKAPAFGKIRLI